MLRVGILFVIWYEQYFISSIQFVIKILISQAKSSYLNHISISINRNVIGIWMSINFISKWL